MTTSAPSPSVNRRTSFEKSSPARAITISSAPDSRTRGVFSTLRVIASTFAPASLANCTAGQPTPPVAPVTNTVSPMVTRATSRTALRATPAAGPSEQANSNGIEVGNRTNASSGSAANSAYPPRTGLRFRQVVSRLVRQYRHCPQLENAFEQTRSPTLKSRTRGPTARTVPLISKPIMTGKDTSRRYVPLRSTTSRNDTPQAAPSTNASSSPTHGTGTSSIENTSGPPVRCKTAAFTVPLLSV